MSMKEDAVRGYVIEVSKLILAVMPQHQKRFKELLTEGCDGDIADFLNKHSKPGLPTPVSVYTVTDEDTPGDEMQSGETYAIYDLTDLYELLPKSELHNLQTQIGEIPRKQEWIVFG